MCGATRLSIVVLAATVLASAAPVRAEDVPAAGPVETLGLAYRAFEEGRLARALRLGARIDRSKLQNPDYAQFVVAQSAYLLGDHARARREFRALAKRRGSRFADVAAWRAADAAWALGRSDEARKAYGALLNKDVDGGDAAVARFRIAEAHARAGRGAKATELFREFRRRHPAHPLEPKAEARLVALGGEQAAVLSVSDRLERADTLTDAHLWHESVAVLLAIGDDEMTDEQKVRRDYQLAMTFYSMRRRYDDAGEILLSIYDELGGEAAFAMFHGARALSRADLDNRAIEWYLKVVETFPRSRWAAEAQFLAGWLEFNMGEYERGIPHLEKMLETYPRSSWIDNTRWFLGFSRFQLGDYDKALAQFERLARRSGKLDGGQGQYWQARALQKLSRDDEAVPIYRDLVGRYPFSWYALLARSRLKEAGIDIGPFGDDPRPPDKAPAIATEVDETLARDPLIRRADELLEAGLGVEAGYEMRRGERAYLRKHRRHKPAALAVLMDRYRRGGDFNRPWMLAVVHGGWRALHAPPLGRARVWWEHAYPLAYRDLVEKHRGLGDNPEYYLFAIMRKESGFDPHTLSYADAIGLLQMIPPTTKKVAPELGLEYTADLLYDPELNIKTGSWYIGRLLSKFKGQIPLGAGSFNSGPGPVMRWLDEHGDHPMDELIELVSYRQTRNYMRRVPETYARYLYLYTGEVYEQPLTVDADYVKNDLTY